VSAASEIVTALARYLPKERCEDACQLLHQDALPKLELMAREIRSIAEAATSKPLADDADEGRAAELVTRGTIALRELDALRRKHTDPLNEEVKAINALFKVLTDPAEALVGKGGKLEKAMLLYRSEKRARIQREQAEAQRLQREAAEREAAALRKVEEAKTDKARAKAMAEAEAASKAQTAVALAAPEVMTQGVRTDSGTVAAREVWRFEVVDAAQVPRSFCIPDERAIRAAVAAGVRQIAGVNIFQEEALTRRPGR
jgi:hypothetical protein